MLFHVSQVPAIIHSQLQLSCKDQRLKGPFLYLFYYILHNVTGKRKPELPGSSHNKSSFYSTRAVLCNVSSRLLIGSDTHWLDYCSPTVVAEHSPRLLPYNLRLNRWHTGTEKRLRTPAHLWLYMTRLWKGPFSRAVTVSYNKKSRDKSTCVKYVFCTWTKREKRCLRTKRENYIFQTHIIHWQFNSCLVKDKMLKIILKNTWLFCETGEFTATANKSRETPEACGLVKPREPQKPREQKWNWVLDIFMRLKAAGSAAFTKSQAYAPLIRIQPFQGDLHSPEMSTAMHDPQITMDLQFHLEHPRLFAK